jgi:hypothetical protein
MKARFLISVLFLSVVLTSCKDDKKKTEDNVQKDAPAQTFNVSFDLIAKADDNFHLYYTEDNTINFTEEKSIWVPIKGNANEQKITFKLPENVLPTDLRVDFGIGVNKQQAEIVLKKFNLEYFGKTFEAKDSLIFNYFYPNKDNTIVDKATSSIKRLSPDQPAGPSLYPHISLVDEINKLIK